MEDIDKLVKSVTSLSPNCKLYRSFDNDGNLLKQLEFIDGKWIDVTEKEQEKIRLEKEILENKNLLKRFNDNDL